MTKTRLISDSANDNSISGSRLINKSITGEKLIGLTVYAEDFGAVGNGLEDDSLAIQSAIDYLGQNGGGTLLLTKRYKVSVQGEYEEISQLYKYCLQHRFLGVPIRFDGQGTGEIFTDFPGEPAQNRALLIVVGYNNNSGNLPYPDEWVKDCQVTGLIFSQYGCPYTLNDGNNPGIKAVIFRFAENCSLTHCKLNGKFHEGVMIKTFSRAITVTDNFAKDCLGASAYNINGAGINNCIISNNYAYGCFDGIEGSGYSNIYSNNALEACKTGILASGTPILRTQEGNVYSNNTIISSLTFGINVKGFARNCVFSDNTILDSGYSGIYVVPNSNIDSSTWQYIPTRCIFTGNQIKNANLANLNPIGNISAHAMVIAAQESVIKDNIIDGGGTAGIGLFILPSDSTSFPANKNIISGLDSITNVTVCPFLWEEEKDHIIETPRRFSSSRLNSQSQNLIPQSRRPDQWFKTAGVSVSSGFQDLFGNLDLYQTTFSATNDYVRTLESSVLSDGKDYAVSVFIKPNGGSNGVQFLIGHQDGTSVIYRIQRASLPSNGAFYTFKVEGRGGWCRLFIYSYISPGSLFIDMASCVPWESAGAFINTGSISNKAIKPGTVSEYSYISNLESVSANTPIIVNSDLKLSSVWNSGSLLMMGDNYLWVDSGGRLRIKSGIPSSDTDGTVVGSQT